MAMRALAEAPPVDADAVLVAAAREEPTAFLALYDRYFERVLGYARLRLRDDATCEDVTSQVFTTALAQLARFRGDGSFAAWLFRIAQNAVHDVTRRSVPRTDEAALAELADPAPGAEELALAAERRVELRRLVASLPDDRRHLLALRYGAGLGFDEIGAIVGAPAGTVRVRVHRILEDLRRRYDHDDD
jgi:RNA polymerase sigma-70 factor (ECF subfamily)